ncbi:MAG: hypothetical protein AWT59_2247 [Candidatus Gallionella acididurans]|uniref:Uncharacterized protein n=1 Tax=Candidatus Gallionella acididurans TaxID=1796491 RepID=A0A139BRL4_9PROT|nr:MAG: hypothetical protein AWT59_2247 [Candidatus Gallionella acididurans]
MCCIGRQPARDGAGDQRAALFLELGYELFFLRQQRVDLRGLGIEETNDGLLFFD